MFHSTKIRGKYGQTQLFRSRLTILGQAPSQQTAKSYGAVCTPDIFGLDKHGTLHYHGRIDAAGRDTAAQDLPRDLVNAMQQLVEQGKISGQQIPSMGCSIKWINTNSSE